MKHLILDYPLESPNVKITKDFDKQFVMIEVFKNPRGNYESLFMSMKDLRELSQII